MIQPVRVRTCSTPLRRRLQHNMQKISFHGLGMESTDITYVVKIVFCVQMINSIIGTGKTVLG